MYVQLNTGKGCQDLTVQPENAASAIVDVTPSARKRLHIEFSASLPTVIRAAPMRINSI
jgi:hypothetical protein